MSKKVAYCAMLIALAMIFSYVEALLPIDFGIPGVKLGIANIVVVVGLYIMWTREVMVISAVRIVLVGILFGNVMSIAYSLAGGVSHNIGQLIVAMILVENMKLIAYIPVLLIAGAVTGFII